MTEEPEGGFIALEAIVAFAILSIALVGLYQAIASSYRVAANASNKEQIVADARSMFARLGNDLDLTESERTGTLASGSTWRLLVTPMSNHDPDDLKHAAYWATFEAYDAGGAQVVSLSTIRLGLSGGSRKNR